MQGQAGVSGNFQFIRIDSTKIKKHSGKISVYDIFESEKSIDGDRIFNRDENFRLIPLVKNSIKENRIVKNKFTKRGLGALLHQCLLGHTGNVYAPNEITDATVNPFPFFCLYGPSGDQRVEWVESDGANVTGLPNGSGVANTGRRGVSVTDAAGILRNIARTYVSTAPYSELEYIFLADINGTAQETTQKGIDNFAIESVALQEAYDETGVATKIGVRSIVGLTPVLQGKTDRVWVHESQQQGEDLIPNLYTGTTIATAVGYIESTSLADTIIDSTITTNAGDSIAVDGTITMLNATTDLSTTSGFDANVHTRKVIEISGSTNNNRKFTIREVVSSTVIKVFEDSAITLADTNGFTAQVKTTLQGYNVFDGRVENEGRVEVTDTGTYSTPNDTPGTVITGESWNSADVAGPHKIGRVFSTDQDIAGIRIIVPIGTPKDLVPEDFKVQLLDPGANGGNPRPAQDADWVDATALLTGQATAIFGAGVYGVEYSFASTLCRGVRLTDMVAFAPTRGVQISNFMCYEEMSAQALTSNTLNLKVKAGDSFKIFDLPDVTSSQDINDFVTSLNTVLRGYQLEAVRSEFGFLWVRATVAGDNSQLFIEAEAGSSANTELGLPVATTTKTGITQAITKLASELLMIIYRIKINGDIPGGYQL